MILRHEIAKIVQDKTDAYGSVRSFEAADAVLALLRERGGEPTWWCAADNEEVPREVCRIGGRNPRPRKDHERCGLRWLLDLGEG